MIEGYKPIAAKPDGEQKAVSPRVIEEHPGVMLVPPGDIPADSLLAIHSVASVFDFADFVSPESSVIVCVQDLGVLECLLSYPRLFGEHFYVLDGFPGFEYKDGFRTATWGLPLVSYHTLATEVNYARHVNETAALASENVMQSERRRTRRKNGSQKAFQNFGIAAADGTIISDEEEEDAENRSE